MRLVAFINESRTLSAVQASVIAEACNLQLPQACKDWGLGALTCYIADDLSKVAPGTPRLVFLDDADQADALGYHSVGPDGVPYAKVFVKTVLADGGSMFIDTKGDGNTVSCCASHEVLEMLVDPSAEEWVDNGMPLDQGSSYALEVADPVQGYSYTVHTSKGKVSVSDYVLPAYFERDNGTNPSDKFDHLHLLRAEWSVGPGGYLIVRDAAGKVSDVFGHSRYPHASGRSARRQNPEVASCSSKDPAEVTSDSSSKPSSKPAARSRKSS